MSETIDGAAPSRTRSDARRNAERVNAAALHMVAQHGSDATVMDIAREAGVGKATVYRNFPTKAALLAFAAEHHGAWLVERLDAAIAADDGWAGFGELVADTVLRIRSTPILLEVLRPQSTPSVPVSELVDARLEALLATLRASGRMRPDATVADLGLLMIGVSEYLAERSAADEECLRGAELIVSALRA